VGRPGRKKEEPGRNREEKGGKAFFGIFLIIH
jgi:hypothetical protein